MKKKLLPLLLIVFTLLISVVIVILPSFSSKNFSYIELKQKLTLEHVLNDTADIELVFFGYAGCLDVCTPRMQAIKLWYETLTKQQQDRINLKFFDLSVPKDPAVPDIFIKSFHPKFKGVYLSAQKLRAYTKEFSVYFSPSLFKKGEIDHSTHLYITKRANNIKELRAIYTSYPYDFTLITKKLQGLLNE